MLAEKRLYQGQPAVTSTVLYTTPAGTTTVLTDLLITNTTAGPITFDLYVAPSATASGLTNAVIYQLTLGPRAFFQTTLALVCNAGDTIRGLQSVAGALTFNLSGYEDTP